MINATKSNQLFSDNGIFYSGMDEVLYGINCYQDALDDYLSDAHTDTERKYLVQIWHQMNGFFVFYDRAKKKTLAFWTNENSTLRFSEFMFSTDFIPVNCCTQEFPFPCVYITTLSDLKSRVEETVALFEKEVRKAYDSKKRPLFVVDSYYDSILEKDGYIAWSLEEQMSLCITDYVENKDDFKVYERYDETNDGGTGYFFLPHENYTVITPSFRLVHLLGLSLSPMEWKMPFYKGNKSSRKTRIYPFEPSRE